MRTTSERKGEQQDRASQQQDRTGEQPAKPEPHYRRAVLDTNVWLEWLVFDDPRLAVLRSAVAEGRVALLGHPHCRAELAHVLERDPIAARAAGPAPQLLDRYDALVQPWPHPLPEAPFSCKDPADQVFLELAYAAGAHWLLTRDKALLRLAGRARRHASAGTAALTICQPEALFR